jgi:hypothetical protein
MNQQESEALAQFCADQYFSFDSRAWARRARYDRNSSTVAAMYLAMTSWYGHEDELERIAADSRAMHASGEAFRRTSQASSFDPSVFSQQVRAEIARRRQSSQSLAHANHAATAARNASV